MSHQPCRRRWRVSPILSILGVIALACSPKADRETARTPDTTAAAGAAGAVAGADSMATAPPGSTTTTDSAATTGMSADQEFLRAMSDHHKGLILMAHETMERKDKLSVKDEARKLDREQDEGLDRLRTALRGDFNDSYEPRVTPDNQAMVDTLLRQSGSAYDRTFRQDVIKHHEQGVAMIDRYLPRLTRSDVKTMAERMRANQLREIDEFKRRLGAS